MSALATCLGYPRVGAGRELKKALESFWTKRTSKEDLETTGKVPGIDAAAFQAAAEKTKSTCPISRLLSPGLEEITLDAKLFD